MFDGKLFVKERFGILEGEMSLGMTEAKFHAQALAYQYGVSYGVPGAVAFYNALNFPDEVADLSWTDSLPDTVVLTRVVCDIPCNECAHRMLTAACYQKCSDEKTAAYLMTAYDTLEDNVLKDRVLRAVDKIAASEEFVLPVVEDILLALDAVLSTPVSETEEIP